MSTTQTNAQLRSQYGKDAVITRKGTFTLVHVDKPTRTAARRRTKEFDPEAFFFHDCPLCQMTKEKGIVVFDDRDPAEDVDPDYEAT